MSRKGKKLVKDSYENSSEFPAFLILYTNNTSSINPNTILDYVADTPKNELELFFFVAESRCYNEKFGRVINFDVFKSQNKFSGKKVELVENRKRLIIAYFLI
ncbi:hypothetical protein CWI38_1053p0030 [Hamiltosporidium tvaerminnensis]|uniref:Uncharacterized protein n=1 Tax=Hamiltosporidium tvaerminnensis TaxID=1176355 RepID=A0A4Q9LTD7_9MICR|nr:hypothetical protein CWI38_1053p0030 [Hamiltosporidium tvaerminnensis]